MRVNNGGGIMLSLARRFVWAPRGWKSIPLLLGLLPQMIFAGAVAAQQAPPKKNVLIINEVGLSHSLTSLMTQQILEGVQETPDLHVEFYSESLDLISFPDNPSRADIRDWLVKKYGAYKLDVVVAVGPDSINFLSSYTQTMFLEVPIVICGSSIQQAGNPRLDSRFTGTWLNYEPAKTIEAALRLFPETRHVAIVAGTSAFDKRALSITKTDMTPSLSSKVDLIYMTDLEMNQLLDRLRQLPDHTIVVYTSFFEDAAGHKFVNATKALPMVIEAANAPVFGMSDTYLGNGIVGGKAMNFRAQGRITARLVSELLAGKKSQDIPIITNSSVYMFDWNQLQRWHIPESRLPEGSVIVFREPSLWERTKWMWIGSLMIILSLSALTIYLLWSRKQLKLARSAQLELSGMLIDAQEKERSRLASELHDDFSQRLALLSLGIENAAEAIPNSPQEASQQLHDVLNSAGEIGADLHTLSHRLHSSTLEKLGLVPGVSALCKEFGAQQGVLVDFASEDFTRPVHPAVALCLFRIVQEGLRNLKKHSGAKKAHVELRQTGGKLLVSVRDEGIGFDPRETKEKQGLGIRSMEERVRLLGGQFKIHSAHGQGTRIEAWVPFQPEPRPAQV